MEKERFSLKKRLLSFKYAFQGLSDMFKNEHNAWIHLFATACAVIAGILLRVSPEEWIALVFAIGVVLIAEAFNTAIEALADLVSPDYHRLVKRAKDLAAGGVLLAAIAAVIAGSIIFVPKIIALFQS